MMVRKPINGASRCISSIPKELYIIKLQGNTHRGVMIYKGGKPPLMIYTALCAVMIYQAYGLDWKVGLVTTHLRALFGTIIQFGCRAQIIAIRGANGKVVRRHFVNEKEKE